LDAPALVDGDRLRGGLFVEGGRGLGPFLDAAEVRFYAPDLEGLQVFAGRTYSPYAGGLALSVTVVPETANFGDGPREGSVLEVRVGGAPVSYAKWAALYTALLGGASEAALPDPSAVAPETGLPNLLCYAFGILPGAGSAGRLPSFAVPGGVPEYRFPFDPGKRDLAYRVEASADLQDWSRVLFDSRLDWPYGWDGETLMLADPAAGPSRAPRQFYRLRVILSQP
jgi:hypothetical protein